MKKKKPFNIEESKVSWLVGSNHHCKSDTWTVMSCTTDYFNDLFVCYQHLSEDVDVSNNWRGFHDEIALNKCDKPIKWLSTPSSGKNRCHIQKHFFKDSFGYYVLYAILATYFV